MSTLTPQQFVATWSHAQLKESALYVSHFNDLCELVGHDKPTQLDKTGATFTYQKGALKSDGGQTPISRQVSMSRSRSAR